MGKRIPWVENPCTGFQASDPKAMDSKLPPYPMVSKLNMWQRCLGSKVRQSSWWEEGGEVTWSPGLPHITFDYSSLCWILSLCSRLSQSYQRKNLSSPCINSTLLKNNVHSFGDKEKPASGKEEKKNGFNSFKRMLSHPLTFELPNEATESNLIKPMRLESVKGYRYLNEL